jgi:hypothetical protein
MSDPQIEGKKKGRPEIYTNELGEIVLSRLKGGESLIDICKDESLPNRETVYRWTVDNKDFSDAYYEARAGRAAWRADEIDRMTHNIEAGLIEPVPAKIILDTYKWQLARENPRRYGDKVTAELTGKDGGAIEITSDPLEVARRVLAIINERNDAGTEDAE